LDERLSLLATEPEHWPTVARLRCFRGIETLSALVLQLEVGDFARFQRPGQLAAWLGLVPSLHQSGESETRGPITKTGSGFARRILVEAAAAPVRKAPGPKLPARAELLWAARQRRRPFLDRRKPATQKRPGVTNSRISDWRSRRAPRRLPHRPPTQPVKQTGRCRLPLDRRHLHISSSWRKCRNPLARIPARAKTPEAQCQCWWVRGFARPEAAVLAVVRFCGPRTPAGPAGVA